MGGGNDEPIDQRAMSGSDDEAPAVADLDNRSIGVAPLHVRHLPDLPGEGRAIWLGNGK
jgi:hypothetical protein